jgi:hypothetical protein
MAKTRGGTRNPGVSGGTEGKDTNYRGKISKIGGISDITDDRSRLAVQRAVSQYQAQYGLPTREVKTAILDAGVYGIGGKDRVVLNRQFYNDSAKLIALKKKGYASGWSVKTTSPLKHTVIHELAHASWQSERAGANPKLSAGVRALYKRYQADVRAGRNPIGKYASSNIDEFWAEGITQATIGTKQSYYSVRLKKLLKKYG